MKHKTLLVEHCSPKHLWPLACYPGGKETKEVRSRNATGRPNCSVSRRMYADLICIKQIGSLTSRFDQQEKWLVLVLVD